MFLAQTPSPLPDAGALKDLDWRVALALIIAGVLLAFLTYFGGPIRDRLAKKPDPAPPIPPPSSAPDPPQANSLGHGRMLPATTAGPAVDAVDRAERRTDQFIDNLLRQIQEAAEREDALERRVHALEQQVQALQNENQRLQTMLWQRGPGQ